MIEKLKVLDDLKIDKNKPLIVAVSGGVDSMVLIDLLYKAKYKVIITHFNHQTRKENEKERDLVISYAIDKNIPYFVYSLKIRSGNFHEKARNERYLKLKEVAKTHKTKYIVTAHHLDDLAETVLMKITRGSNLYGYAGIHKIVNEDDFIYLKPLLENTKQEIIDYAFKNEIKYLEDTSNYKDSYMRNRYRHTIIPIMKQENSNLLNSFNNYHNQVANAFNYIRKNAIKHLDGLKIKLNTFNKQDIAIKNEMIAYLLEQYEIDFTYDLVIKINQILSNNKPNQTYNLSRNYVLIKSYNEAFIEEKTNKISFEVPLKMKENTLPNMKKITLLNNISHNNINKIKICYNELTLPLIARTRKNGDVVKFKYGHKKVKDLLIDLKIPRHLRDDLIVITDSSNTILYIENAYLNETLGNKNNIYIKIGEDKWTRF